MAAWLQVVLTAVLGVALMGLAGVPTASRAQGSATTADAPEPPFFKRAREGWFWYIDPAPPPPPPTPEPAVSAPKATPADPQDRDLAAFKAFQIRFERALNAATINPSEANVAHFLEVYAESRRKASVFSDTAQAVALRMPWIDETFTGSRPTSPPAMRAYDAIRMQDRDQLMREMAQSYGLYFFFRANCAYCHVQAPMLRQFADKYGFTVFAVSMDGSSLPQFPKALRDNGLVARMSETLGIPAQHFVTPAVVLAQPSAGLVVPIGFGAMNMDEMVERISTVVRVRDRGAGQGAASQITALTGAPAPAARPGADLPGGRRHQP